MTRPEVREQLMLSTGMDETPCIASVGDPKEWAEPGGEAHAAIAKCPPGPSRWRGPGGYQSPIPSSLAAASRRSDQ
jgi:hypothetical protein